METATKETVQDELCAIYGDAQLNSPSKMLCQSALESAPIRRCFNHRPSRHGLTVALKTLFVARAVAWITVLQLVAEMVSERPGC